MTDLSTPISRPAWALPEGALPRIRYRPRRLGHVNLFVRDMPRTMEFLTRVCGFEETARESSTGTGFVSNGNTHHDVGVIDLPGYARLTSGRPAMFLGPEHRGSEPALNHFGWEMESEAELVAAYRRAKAAGLLPRVTDAATSRSNYLFDCDGVQHQFYSDTTRDWRSVYTGGEASLHSNPPWDPDHATPSTEPHYTVNPEYRRVDAAPLHPLRVSHAVMLTENFDRALAFYQDVAGLELRVGNSEAGVAYLHGTDSPLDLILVHGPGRQDHLHHASFALAPGEDLDAIGRQLAQRDIVVEAVRRLPHKASMFIRDPDGLLLEFYTFFNVSNDTPNMPGPLRGGRLFDL